MIMKPLLITLSLCILVGCPLASISSTDLFGQVLIGLAVEFVLWVTETLSTALDDNSCPASLLLQLRITIN